ncbi:Acetyltransferase (GNAT) family protein [Desulfatibacillum alkenivorans DSM 16219]|jgi:GNAT superfamily N-acetyltransferase|uniref:Acetyltransferase (GNAT) family protein n=1 Tax=Desulfatibacillum alkenivorans DSM 16219 TaxID=1121393 RepID=A0A1M6VZM9_9BACT|nr:GNAT family N-acetyltransferase [Desulfatibacillum alkenivorans]SHK86909.1 Acetyltransferase (GNAT) family protein [Desulfatibacillum alkenivorans DSM 16219]
MQFLEGGLSRTTGDVMEWKHLDYIISDDKSLINPAAVHGFLRASYWAADRSLETVQKSIENSLCFGAYLDGEQVGFARAVTDGATTAFLADVIIEQSHRGRGLGKKVVAAAMEHPEIAELTHILKTKDAHGLYEQFGFIRSEFMMRRR